MTRRARFAVLCAVAALFTAVESTSRADEAAPPPRAKQIGPLYPVREPDMLTAIDAEVRRRVANGEWDARNRASVARLRDYTEGDGPPSVGLAVARASATVLFDPSITVSRDITDAKGRVIHKAGEIVNPLDKVAWRGGLLFFDGGDPRQRRRALAFLQRADAARFKPILVAGAPLALGREWKRRVYFDQNGALAARFGIDRAPTAVYQNHPDDRALTIETLGLEEEDEE